MLRTNREKVVNKMVKLEIAIASLVLKWKNTMIRGMATPPPPTPAMLDKAMIKANTTKPTISKGFGGKGDLCSHLPIVAPSYLMQRT